MPEDMGTQQVEPFSDELGWPPSLLQSWGLGAQSKLSGIQLDGRWGTRSREPDINFPRSTGRDSRSQGVFCSFCVLFWKVPRWGLWPRDYAYIHTFLAHLPSEVHAAFTS